jgi:hypothetical protein
MDKRSIALQRRIACYPNDNLKLLLEAESAITNTSKSKIVEQSITDRYKNMPPDELSAIQNKANAMAAYPAKR